MPKTAAIIIIGNEILSGKVEDRNSSFLASGLRKLGVDVRRVSVIPDEVDVIAAEVGRFSREFDVVFTSGGVGPTHDDVTMEGVARAFGLELVRNAELAEIINDRCGGTANKPTLRMADLPKGAELIEGNGLRFPAVAVRNVYIFPGIPEYLFRKFDAIKERFRSEPFILKKVYVSEEECLIAPALDTLVEEFSHIDVGSYPKVGLPDYKVVVMLESTDPAELARAEARLMELLPAGVVVRKE